MACILLSHILEDFNNWLCTFVLSAWLMLSKRCQFWALALMCDTIHISLFKYCLVSALKQLKTLRSSATGNCLFLLSLHPCCPWTVCCDDLLQRSVLRRWLFFFFFLKWAATIKCKSQSCKLNVSRILGASSRCTKLTLVLLEKAERCTHDGFCCWGFKMAVNWSSSWTCKHKMQYFKYWIFWMEVVNRHTASCWLGSALCELFRTRSVCVFMWQMFCSSWSVALRLLIWDMSSAACPRKQRLRLET